MLHFFSFSRFSVYELFCRLFCPLAFGCLLRINCVLSVFDNNSVESFLPVVVLGPQFEIKFLNLIFYQFLLSVTFPLKCRVLLFQID